MSDIDPSKLKVTELRDELKKHGLDTKGKKEQLVKRLEKFLAGEAADTSLDNSQSQDADTSSQEEHSQEEPTPAEAAEPEPAAAEEAPDQTEAEPQSMETAPEPAAATTEEQATPAESAEQKMDETDAAAAPWAGAEEDPAPAAAASETAKEEPAATATETAPTEQEAASEETPAAAATTAETDKPVDEQKPSTDSGDRRKRSRSRDRSGHHHSSRGDSPSRKRDRRDDPPVMESLDWVEGTNVQLDRYNSDLNCEVVNEGFTLKPQSFGGFGYMWAGCRATYGVSDGKVAFQMKGVKNLRIQIGDESIGANHVSRVGWSVDGGDYQLGEYKHSWGYGGTAKFSSNRQFSDFNVKFYNNDVVTCYLDMTGENVLMYFAKNDMAMEKAVEFPKADLEGAPLFPAVATKNQILDMNFGQLEEPWYPLLGEEGEWKFIHAVPEEERVRSVKPPMKKEECEVLLLVGLPGSGKSYFASEKQTKEPNKRYYVLGTNNVIDKMRVEGLPRKNNYHGRWDVLFDQANDCLRKMLETATKRYKNYILDQTNVYDTAQRRKMRPFAGFNRKAVVVLPTDKVFRERIDKRTKEEGKEVPETAVLEMKANFSMPSAPIETALKPEVNDIAIAEAKEEAERLAKEEEERKVKEEEDKKAKAEEEAKAKAEPAEAAAAEGGEAAPGTEQNGESAADTPAAAETETQAASEETPAADAAAAPSAEEVKSEAEVKAEPTEEAEKGATDAQQSEKSEVKKEEEKMDTTEVKTEPTAESSTTDEQKPEDKKEGESEDKKAEDKPAEKKAEEPVEIVFDEILFTELSGDMARELLAKYIKEGQVKFPPGSRRFRREDRRIGKDERQGGWRDNRDGGYRDRRDGGYNNRGGGGGGYNRYGGSGGGYQSRGGYDNRRGGGYGGYNSGGYNNRGGGGYRSGGSYNKGYGGGNSWGGQGGYGQGGWNNQGWGNQGWGNQQGSWGQGYGNQSSWGNYNQGYGNQGYGSNQSYGQQSWGSSGGQSGGSSSWNQGGYGNSHNSGGYNSYGGGSGY